MPLTEQQQQQLQAQRAKNQQIIRQEADRFFANMAADLHMDLDKINREREELARGRRPLPVKEDEALAQLGRKELTPEEVAARQAEEERAKADVAAWMAEQEREARRLREERAARQGEGAPQTEEVPAWRETDETRARLDALRTRINEELTEDEALEEERQRAHEETLAQMRAQVLEQRAKDSKENADEEARLRQEQARKIEAERRQEEQRRQEEARLRAQEAQAERERMAEEARAQARRRAEEEEQEARRWAELRRREAERLREEAFQAEERRLEEERVAREAMQNSQQELARDVVRWDQLQGDQVWNEEALMPKDTFHYLTAEEQAGMGKIKKACYHVKRVFWQRDLASRRAKCRKAVAGLNRIHGQLTRNDTQGELTIQPEPQSMEAGLERNTLWNEAEQSHANLHLLHSMGRYAQQEWKALLEANGIKDAFKGLRVYGAAAQAEQAAQAGVDNFQVMNAYLRAGRDVERMPQHLRARLTPELRRLTDAAADGMKLARLPFNLTLQRNIDLDGLSAMLGINEAQAAHYFTHYQEQANQHPILQEKGFCSASLAKNAFTRRKVDLVILAPKGTAAVAIGGTSLGRVPLEEEVLLAPGTKFRLVSVKMVKTQPLPGQGNRAPGQQDAAQGGENYHQNTFAPTTQDTDVAPDRWEREKDSADTVWRVYLEALPMHDGGVPRDQPVQPN